MSIFTKRTNGTVDILPADTVIFTVPANERIAVSHFSCDSTAATTVTFFRSPDNTSAGGKRLDSQIFVVDETFDIGGVVGAGFEAGERIIAVGLAAGVNATMAYTLYDGDDV